MEATQIVDALNDLTKAKNKTFADLAPEYLEALFNIDTAKRVIELLDDKNSGVKPEQVVDVARFTLVRQLEEEARKKNAILYLPENGIPKIISNEPTLSVENKARHAIDIDLKALNASNSPGSLASRFRQLQDQVLDRVSKIRSLLKDQGSMQCIDRLAQHLIEVAESTPKKRIGFYGRRGAGKTTLINRLVGTSLLQTGGDAAVTAAITQIHGWEKNEYLAVVYSISKEDWSDLADSAKKELKKARKHNQELLLATELQNQLTALWGEDAALIRGNSKDGFAWEQVPNAMELIPPQFQQLIECGFISKSTSSLEELKHFLDKHTDRREECSAWPLVFKVNVFGPFPTLCQGSFSLLDIPGDEDGDFSLQKKFHEGQAMCDRLYYMPHPSTVFTPITAKNCASLDTFILDDFGIITSNLHKQVKEEKWDPQNPAEYFRKRLAKHFDGDDKRAIFQETKVFCLENKKPSLYQNLYEDFVQKELLTIGEEEKNAIVRFVNEVNLSFAVLQTSLEFDKQQLKELVKKLDGINFSVALGQAQVDKWDIMMKVDMAHVKLFDPNTHYKTLQSICSNSCPIGFAYQLTEVCFNYTILQSIEATIKTKADELIYQVKSFIMTELHAVRAQLAERLAAALLTWTPVLLQFKQQVINDVANALKSLCQSELPLLHRTGTGCRNEMIQLLEAWWTKNRERLSKVARHTSLASSERQLQTISTGLKSWFFEVMSNLTKINQSDELKSLVNFISTDPAKNEIESPEIIEVVPPKVLDALENVSKKYPDIVKMPSKKTFGARPSSGEVCVLPGSKEGEYKIAVSVRKSPRKSTRSSLSGSDMCASWNVNHTSLMVKLFQKTLAKLEMRSSPNCYNAPLNLIMDIGNSVAPHMITA